jgi:hypothetical protein
MAHKNKGTVLGIVLEATGSGHGWAVWGQSCPSMAGDFSPKASGWRQWQGWLVLVEVR